MKFLLISNSSKAQYYRLKCIIQDSDFFSNTTLEIINRYVKRLTKIKINILNYQTINRHLYLNIMINRRLPMKSYGFIGILGTKERFLPN